MAQVMKDVNGRELKVGDKIVGWIADRIRYGVISGFGSDGRAQISKQDSNGEFYKADMCCRIAGTES